MRLPERQTFFFFFSILVLVPSTMTSFILVALIFFVHAASAALGQYQQLSDLFVDSSIGTDVNNTGTNASHPLRSLAGAAAQFALGIGLSPGQFASQTIYVRAGNYTGASNCHVMFGDGTGRSPARVQFVGYDSFRNLSYAEFRCGHVTLSMTEAYVHFFALSQVNVTRFAYRDFDIDANAIVAVPPVTGCTTAILTSRFGDCPRSCSASASTLRCKRMPTISPSISTT
jgi:hypothetical protein